MARFARVVVPGVPHYVTQRGNRRQRMLSKCCLRGIAVQAGEDMFRDLAASISHDAAVSATPAGGKVTLSTLLTESHTEVVVRDTGPGLPEENQDRLFEPFYSTKAHSYGLGLPLVKQIVTEHMGEIEARSLPEGGAEFRIRIPLRWAGLRA